MTDVSSSFTQDCKFLFLSHYDSHPYNLIHLNNLIPSYNLIHYFISGTYTIDADNYTEEQKARMSIDREIIAPELSPAQRTHNFVESTLQYVTKSSNLCSYEPPIEEVLTPSPKPSPQNLSRNNSAECNINIGSTSFVIEDNGTLKTKILSPQDSLTQISIESNECLKQTNLVKKVLNIDSPVVRRSKIIFASASSKPPDHEEDFEYDTTGSFTSITTCGVFNRDEPKRQTKNEISPIRRSSLTQSDIFVENIKHSPPPTKIPSPIHSLSRPRSRTSLELTDETELYLKQTQNVITSLQARLNSETQTKHVRHNSFDSKNTTNVLNNKLVNFQTKTFQNIDQTKQPNVGIATRSPTHKLYNSPNNSPIKRSNSFSIKQISSFINTCTPSSDVIYINTGATPIVSAQRVTLNPNVEKKGTAVHRSMSTASIKNNLNPIHRPNANHDIYSTSHPMNRSDPYGGLSAYKHGKAITRFKF